MAKRSGSAGTIIWLVVVVGFLLLINAPNVLGGNINAYSLIIPAMIVYGVVSVIRGAMKKKAQPRAVPGYEGRSGPNIEPTEPARPNIAPVAGPSTSSPSVTYPSTAVPGPTPSARPAPSPAPTPDPAPRPTPSPTRAPAPHPAPPLQPSAVEPPADVITRITELKKAGRTIEAIEVLREATGMELYEASQYVRKL